MVIFGNWLWDGIIFSLVRYLDTLCLFIRMLYERKAFNQYLRLRNQHPVLMQIVLKRVWLACNVFILYTFCYSTFTFWPVEMLLYCEHSKSKAFVLYRVFFDESFHFHEMFVKACEFSCKRIYTNNTKRAHLFLYQHLYYTFQLIITITEIDF